MVLPSSCFSSILHYPFLFSIQLAFAVRTMTGGTAKFSAPVSGNRCAVSRQTFHFDCGRVSNRREVAVENSARDRGVEEWIIRGISWNATAKSWIIGLVKKKDGGCLEEKCGKVANRDLRKIEAWKIYRVKKKVNDALYEEKRIGERWCVTSRE